MDTKDNCFDKPLWTLMEMGLALSTFPGHLKRFVPTLLGKGLSGAMRERIMLAVATENRCRYCKAVHVTLAHLAPLSDQEVESLIRKEPALSTRDLDDLSLEQLVVEFVRDLARRGFVGRDPRIWERLSSYFSPAEKERVESVAHVMNFANRVGNNFDALCARLTNGCVEDDVSWMDLLVVSGMFLMVLPIVGPLLGPLALPQWKILLRS